MAQGKDGPKIKPPELGAYRYGTLTGSYYYKSKQYGHHEVKLVGNWENGEDYGHWYACWKAVTALCAAGMLTQLPGDGKKFQVTPGTRCCIYRQAVGGDSKAHDWFAAVYDGNGEQITLQATAVPFEPVDAPASAPPPPPQAGPPGPPAQVGSPQAGPPAQAPTPGAPHNPAGWDGSQGQGNQEAATSAHYRKMLAEVDACYGLCLVVAAYRQVQFYEVPTSKLDVNGLQAGAATIMIRLERADYDASVDRRPMYLKRLRRLEHSLFPDQCPPPPEDVKANGNTKKSKPDARVLDPLPDGPPFPDREPTPAGVEEDETDLPF